MIESIKTYSTYFSALLKSKQGRQLLFSEYNKKLYLKSYVSKVNADTKWKAVREAITWFKVSQDAMADDGFGTYYLNDGWTSSYPETSGYIVPTLLKFAKKHNDEELRTRAQKCLDWLVFIQKPSGGWQGGYVHQNRPEIVFNTGQVIRGMIAGYQHFNEQKYLDSASLAADWLVKIQAENGSFDKNVYLGLPRVYDSYVVAPVLELNKIVNNPAYEKMARRNIDWILDNKQTEDGWFEDCDNTVAHNNAPITHTIAYTVDGILDCALLLKDDRYFTSVLAPAEKLLEEFFEEGILKGRYDEFWWGTEDFITTGGAQLSIIWNKLYHATKDEKWRNGHVKMNSLLVALQQRHISEKPETKGALFGSFPFWGRYERFGCPNWTTKYFVDSLMLEEGLASDA